MSRNTEFALDMGDKFPYDGGEEFWDGAVAPPPPTDWAHRAARGVLSNLTDRSGVQDELKSLDHDVRAELVSTIAAIIRAAAPFT